MPSVTREGLKVRKYFIAQTPKWQEEKGRKTNKEKESSPGRGEAGPRRSGAGKHWAHQSIFFKLQVTTHCWIVKLVESVVAYILLKMK